MRRKTVFLAAALYLACALQIMGNSFPDIINTMQGEGKSIGIPPQYVTISATNNFPTSNGKSGLINFDGVQGDAPFIAQKQVGMTAAFEAINNQMGADSYKRVWVDESYWNKSNYMGIDIPLTDNKDLDYTTNILDAADNNAIYTANFKKECNISVTRNNPYGGIVRISINGNTYPSPAEGLSKGVVESHTITLEAQEEVASNHIQYTFVGWLNNATSAIESSNPTYSIQPTEHRSYTAVFRGTPDMSQMNIQTNYLVAGQAPTITWTDIPNTEVTTYRVYGQTYRNWGQSNLIIYPEVLITSVPRGTQYYSCNTWAISGSTGADLLNLRIAPYYSTESTESTSRWFGFFFNGEWMSDPNSPEKRNSGIQKDEVITKYAVANYPNPFNPTTTINYQVPESGHVTLKVYDIMGKEIATLVDGVKNRGNYNINFSMEQYRLASGIYFCRLSAGKNMLTTKMILSK
jgi:hypothetical protein